MCKPHSWTSATIAAPFLAAGLALCSLAAPPAGPAEKVSGYELSRPVKVDVGATYLRDGDMITIDEIVGTSDKVAAGNLYLVKGTYKLASKKQALLSVYTTTSARNHMNVPTQNTQTLKVDEGEGRYSLIFYMWQDGNPHLSFYPVEGGSSFASLYFGTGDTLLTRGWWK